MCDLGGTLRVKESKKSRFHKIFFVCQVVERVEFGDQIENTTQVIQSDLFIPKTWRSLNIPLISGHVFSIPKKVTFSQNRLEVVISIFLTLRKLRR